MASLIVLLVIVGFIGAILGYYAPGIFKGERPYGLNADLGVAVLVALLVALGDWYLAPRMMPSLQGLSLFAVSIIEPTLSVLLVLWLMRYFKK